LTLGTLLGVELIHDRQYFGDGVSVWEGVLFLGAAMSVTAFPVLARILEEHGLTQTRIGMLSLAAGSLHDLAAWTILALGLADSGPGSALRASLGALLYAFGVLFIGRPLLKCLATRIGADPMWKGILVPTFVALLMIVVWLSGCSKSPLSC
jgi:Kef-type K+ transport system membrane component KefB